jgi:hypothetical protein
LKYSTIAPTVSGPDETITKTYRPSPSTTGDPEPITRWRSGFSLLAQPQNNTAREGIPRRIAKH